MFKKSSYSTAGMVPAPTSSLFLPKSLDISMHVIPIYSTVVRSTRFRHLPLAEEHETCGAAGTTPRPSVREFQSKPAERRFCHIPQRVYDSCPVRRIDFESGGGGYIYTHPQSAVLQCFHLLPSPDLGLSVELDGLFGSRLGGCVEIRTTGRYDTCPIGERRETR